MSVAAGYRAFLSYSHRDQAVATWLHRALETYRIPSKLVGAITTVGAVPARLHPIFRDRDELCAAPSLGSAIEAALDASMFLVVICSPSAAKSRWVNEEILAFKRRHGEARVFAVIASGTPHAAPEHAAQECFPLALRFTLGPDGALSATPAEPIAADLRAGADGRQLAKLKLAAGLTGLRLDDLVRRETQRRLRRSAYIATAAVAGMVFTGALALYANARRMDAEVQRRIADEQRGIAEREATTARAAADFLIGTFALSSPATENPKTITALTILGRSAERARVELADQPLVQARLIDTLGQAYNNLGLLEQARGAIEGASAAIAQAGPNGASAELTLAATYAKLGALDRAMASVRRAQALLGTTNDLPEVRARAALTEGLIRTAAGDTAAGIAAFDRALVIYRGTLHPDQRKLALALMNRGVLLSDDGQFDAAEASLNEALKISRSTLGEAHRETGQSWFSLAQNAFLAGKLALAERRIGKALAIERRVLEANNPIIADALSMQGQIYQGQDKLELAERSLDQAIAIYRTAFGRPHFLIGIAQVYLALVQSKRGQTDQALLTLDLAKHNYDVSYGKLHANHGDLLVNRATILAHAGRSAEAHNDCTEGLRILGRTLGADAAYTKSMAKVCAGI